MSKAISSFKTDAEKLAVINRRINGKSGGLGFWAAQDAKVAMGKPKEKKEESGKSSLDNTEI